MSRPALAMTLLLTAASPAFAGWKDFCGSLYGRIFPSPVFSELEKARFAEALRNADLPHIHRLRNSDEALFWHGFQRIPEEIREKLRSLPADRKIASRILHELDSLATGYDGGSFFRTVQNVWDGEIMRGRTGEAGGWIDAHLPHHLEKTRVDENFSRETTAAWNAITRKIKAADRWSHGAGAVPLPMRQDGGRAWIRIAGEEFPARRYRNGWAIEVPRRLVTHPAWNPLETKKLMGIARSGTAPPKIYETMLGHDGKFYLLDGNHRFEFDTRDAVTVRIPDPPSTTSLRLWFDAVNHPQPSEDRLLDLFDGKIGEADLVDPRFRNRLQFPLDVRN